MIAALPRLLAALLLLLCVATASARADDKKHGSIGVGSATFLDGPAHGAWVAASFQWAQRIGARVDGYTRGPFDSWLLEGAMTYQFAAARPHLVIAGSFGAGVHLPDPAAVLCVGLITQFRPLFKGRFPIALELLTGVHVITDRDPLDVAITSGLGLSYTW